MMTNFWLDYSKAECQDMKFNATAADMLMFHCQMM